MKTHIIITIISILFINSLKAQEKTKDTLFFKLDKYLYQSESNPKKYIIKDNYDTSEGAIYFVQKKIINTSKPKKIICFKKFAHTSRLFKLKDNKKLNDVKVMNLTDSYIIVLVNKKNKKTEYIQVSAEFTIE
ncbi:hypothetical protein [Flavobacterium hydrophilum]|uniref:Uncharacterized protein n=1 Tax=Flavobacterium hydrophilum TaxID=2211445 RepID=A0A2V4C332_9FLAO|nr:hypothetical protein [Flavobacterium hydrophilum]PXY45222.1 hypothetical protein DMB68_11040 [Flavobacterium hydrophilum]